MQICSLKQFFTFQHILSNECISWIHMTYAVIFFNCDHCRVKTTVPAGSDLPNSVFLNTHIYSSIIPCNLLTSICCLLLPVSPC